MTIELNDSLLSTFDPLDYIVPPWDSIYDHVWYLDPAFSTEEKIWVWRIPATEPCQGVKDMGYVTPHAATKLDVVFITYHEPDAEKNWKRVLAKAPVAKRVDGVTGILEAHQAAARLSATDMFFVVDGDAYLLDDFEFDFSPGIFDRDCVYVYHSVNPINQLSYGYGGVKIFPKQALLDSTTANTDITTSVGSKFKIIDKISNITAFNTSSFNAWRSGFRECAKLAAGVIGNANADENLARIAIWQTVGVGKPYGASAVAGAKAGAAYGDKYRNNPKRLSLINNRTWLEEYYGKHR